MTPAPEEPSGDDAAAAPHVIAAGSGAQRLLGFVATVHEDRAEVTLDLDARHLNRSGVLHGGIATTLLDGACGYACSRRLAADMSVPVVTLSLTTNYVAGVSEGRVTATARVAGGGAATLFAAAELHDADGRLLVTATGVFRRAKPRRRAAAARG